MVEAGWAKETPGSADPGGGYFGSNTGVGSIQSLPLCGWCVAHAVPHSC